MKKKIVVVKAIDDLLGFQQDVNRYLAQKWKLYGEMKIVMDSSEGGDGYIFYYQMLEIEVP